VTWSSVTLPEDSTGRASASELLATLTTTFPDVRLASVAQFGVDDVVVSEWTVTATGRSTTLHGLDIAVVKDGRVVSGASYANRFEMSGEERVCREPSPGR